MQSSFANNNKSKKATDCKTFVPNINVNLNWTTCNAHNVSKFLGKNFFTEDDDNKEFHLRLPKGANPTTNQICLNPSILSVVDVLQNKSQSLGISLEKMCAYVKKYANEPRPCRVLFFGNLRYSTGLYRFQSILRNCSVHPIGLFKRTGAGQGLAMYTSKKMVDKALKVFEQKDIYDGFFKVKVQRFAKDQVCDFFTHWEDIKSPVFSKKKKKKKKNNNNNYSVFGTNFRHHGQYVQ